MGYLSGFVVSGGLRTYVAEITGRHPGEKRRAHSIRFTEAEWTGIQKAAARHGLTPAEIVRARALGLPDKPFHADMPASFSPGHVALIEATCRAVHLLATMATQPMPYEEVDALLGAAHTALIATLDEEPAGAVAGESLSSGRRRVTRRAAAQEPRSGLIRRRSSDIRPIPQGRHPKSIKEREHPAIR